ncbi:hypothetical protein N7468_001311 [Penicillium chermesinum]|uniref:Uncharacterized protein n=1 Tax=Penicillium chermesinum TaxID=63820 RepID=A0A9W9PIL8_9EURO|nr:uncharacterized protein N7468_001311 [Penicillium chermesinum]KAJ5246328.1 hypothetical protein N7468_001311 [Penicillium chermesinum]
MMSLEGKSNATIGARCMSPSLHQPSSSVARPETWHSKSVELVATGMPPDLFRRLDQRRGQGEDLSVPTGWVWH